MNSSKLVSLTNRCIKESVEIRTQDRYVGEFFCGNDIAEGQEFRSKANEMVLITDLLLTTELNSTGFVAHFTFESAQTNVTTTTTTTTTTAGVNEIEPVTTTIRPIMTGRPQNTTVNVSTSSPVVITTTTMIENTSKQVNVSENEIKTDDLTTKSIKYSHDEVDEEKSDFFSLQSEQDLKEDTSNSHSSNQLQSIDENHEKSLDILVSSLSTSPTKVDIPEMENESKKRFF